MRRKNQTEIHQRLGEMALIWINTRATTYGMNGTVEVPYRIQGHHKSFIADAITVGRLQSRFYAKYRDKYQYLHNRHGCQFEAKVSISDFKKLKNVIPCCELNWVVTPKGLIGKDDVPKPWGWLEQSGSGLREVIKPEWVEQPKEYFHELCETLVFNSQFRDKRMDIKFCPECRGYIYQAKGE